VRLIKNNIPLLEMSLNLEKIKGLQISLLSVERLFNFLGYVVPFAVSRVGRNFLEGRNRVVASGYPYKIFGYNIFTSVNEALTFGMLKLTNDAEKIFDKKLQNYLKDHQKRIRDDLEANDLNYLKNEIQLQLKEVVRLLFTFLRNASIPVTFFVVGNRFPTCFSTLSFIGYDMYNTVSDMFADNQSSKNNSHEESAQPQTEATADNTNEEEGEEVGSAYLKIFLLAVKVFFLNLDIKLLRQQVRAFDPKELFHNSVMQHIINPLPTNLQPWAGTALGSVSLVAFTYTVSFAFDVLAQQIFDEKSNVADQTKS
jgi:uncharacterized protein (DUF697 family)